MNDDKKIDENEIEFEETNEAGDELSLKDKLKTLKEKLKEKEKEAKENLDGWQRARAEVVNKEKQIQQEKIELFKSAAGNILEEIIPTFDSFEMAKRNKEAWEKVDSNWRVGIEYIFQNLFSVCENNGLKKIDPKVGEIFDVNKMSAVEEVETTDASMDHKIAEIIQTGYELNGKLLREAKVKLFIIK